MLTRTCIVCGTEFEREDVPKEYLYEKCLCSRDCSNKHKKEYREKNDDRCSRCSKKLPEYYEKSNCPQCLEQERKWYKKNKEYHKKQMKKRRQKLKSEGNCIQCGSELPEYVKWIHTRCPECLEKNRNKRFRDVYATDAEIRNGLHTDMVENKLDV